MEIVDGVINSCVWVSYKMVPKNFVEHYEAIRDLVSVRQLSILMGVYSFYMSMNFYLIKQDILGIFLKCCFCVCAKHQKILQ